MIFNKTIIPLALVGYEMIMANSALRASLAMYSVSITSYPMRARGIIVKYTNNMLAKPMNTLALHYPVIPF